MAVSTATNQTSVVLTSTTQAIPVPFQFFDTSDLVVVKTDQTTAADTTLTISSHYSVSGGDGSNGTVTMVDGAAATGDTITVYRSIPYTQTTELEEGDPLPSSALEQRLDRLTIQIQQVKAIAERALRLGETSPAIGSADIKDPTSKFLAFDAADNLTGYTAAQAAALLALSGETQAVAIWADDAARALEVPTVVGQLGVQLDSGHLYRATALAAGSWTRYAMLLSSNNLSDVDDAATARTNLDVLQDVDDVIQSGHLATDCVTADAIAAGSVDTTELAGAAVETAKLANLNVTTGKLADGAVTTDKTADNAITVAKLQQLAAYSFLLNATGSTANATNTKISALTEESAPATGDWLLGEESGGAVRKFDAGNFQKGWIYQSTATASNDATVEFTGLDTSLNHVFVLENLVPATDGVRLNARVSDDNGSSFESGASDYQFARSSVNVGGTAGGDGDATSNEMALTNNQGSDTGELGISGVVYCLSFGDASVKSRIQASLSGYDASTQIQLYAAAGSYETASQLNGVQFLFASGNVESGTIKHYTLIES